MYGIFNYMKTIQNQPFMWVNIPFRPMDIVWVYDQFCVFSLGSPNFPICQTLNVWGATMFQSLGFFHIIQKKPTNPTTSFFRCLQWISHGGSVYTPPKLIICFRKKKKKTKPPSRKRSADNKEKTTVLDHSKSQNCKCWCIMAFFNVCVCGLQIIVS